MNATMCASGGCWTVVPRVASLARMATFDRGVELSRYTGQITHRIAPDIDEERDTLVHEGAEPECRKRYTK